MKDNGGPAFPFTWEGENGPCAESGMSLRDHFAGLAMQGFLAANPVCDKVDVAGAVAKAAYEISDAMLTEKGRER